MDATKWTINGKRIEKEAVLHFARNVLQEKNVELGLISVEGVMDCTWSFIEKRELQESQ